MNYKNKEFYCIQRLTPEYVDKEYFKGLLFGIFIGASIITLTVLMLIFN